MKVCLSSNFSMERELFQKGQLYLDLELSWIMFMASDDWRMEGISMSRVIVNDLLYFFVDDLGDS